VPPIFPSAAHQKCLRNALSGKEPPFRQCGQRAVGSLTGLNSARGRLLELDPFEQEIGHKPPPPRILKLQIRDALEVFGRETASSCAGRPYPIDATRCRCGCALRHR
jgi:hypothetical protein